MSTVNASAPAPELPRPQRPWTDDLLEWKLAALRRVLGHLQHCCSGPAGRAKPLTLSYAVRYVVAADIDPDSLLGTHLQHLLTGAIANEITRREDLLPDFRHRFPGTPDVSPAFLTKYVNSRWWCEALCELEHTCCRDVLEAVEGAIAAAEEECRQIVRRC